MLAVPDTTSLARVISLTRVYFFGFVHLTTFLNYPPRTARINRKQVHHHRFFAAGYKHKPRHQYERLYDDVEFQLEHGLMVGIDNREDWICFHNTFYFDENSNLIYDCFMDHYSDRFRLEIRDLYEYILNAHHGRKPAPTIKQHYADRRTGQNHQWLSCRAAGVIYNRNKYRRFSSYGLTVWWRCRC
jgi:aromatic ring-cleaving dioxygenase